MKAVHRPIARKRLRCFVPPDGSYCRD